MPYSYGEGRQAPEDSEAHLPKVSIKQRQREGRNYLQTQRVGPVGGGTRLKDCFTWLRDL